MKKALLLALLSIMAIASATAQQKISGTLIDRDSKEPVPMVTVQLLKADSAFVSGSVSNDSGKFVIQTPAPGKYLLNAVMLKEAQVTAQALKVTLKEDTFVYNSAAYRTPEGSTIEELVKRLPGAQVSDDGKITINGKEVKKIMLDGKEFMTGDTKTAMKNIPTSIIDKVKAYDQKSDLARVTGIDDGDEQTVLDFGTKAGMGNGTMANVDLGVGTKDRYAERLFGGWFNKEARVFVCHG